MKNLFRGSITALALSLLVGFNATAAELAINGDLETGDLTGWEIFATAPPSTASVSGVNSSAGDFSLNINNQTEASAFVVKQANVGVGLLMPGQEVTISFDARGSFGVGGVLFAEVFSEIAGGGVSSSILLGGAPIFVDADPDVWTTFTFTTILGPDVSGGMTLQFAAVTGAITDSFADVFIDNVSITADVVVPVPAAAWLMISALGFLGITRKRKA